MPGLFYSVALPGNFKRVDTSRCNASAGDISSWGRAVLGGHSFVTPLATRATSAKTAIVVTTKAGSA
ncbi:hypothetical protein [Streptomyces sp. BK239]|uniref:hypothetical protein n=1 Tax=Streptomyces sp. BK239 TaxID=2512155 RepID=UPI00102D021B|nr:hypothetical protein [Streptomyces sp. BK239]